MTNIAVQENSNSISPDVIFSNLDVAENTSKEYKQRVKLFLEFLGDDQINVNSYLEFKRYLRGRTDFTVSTKNKYLITAKIFLKEMNRRGLLPVDITQNIKGFKQSKKHKKDGLNEKEVTAIVERLQTLEETSKNIRLKALISLLVLQGLRQIEIIRLNKEDFNEATNTLQVQGKGQDDSEAVNLNPIVVAILKEHVKVNRIGSGPMFRSFSNRHDGRISTRTIKREVATIFDELNIEKTTHGFRHYFATKLLKKFDIRDVRKQTRHKSYDMLLVYDDEIDTKKKSLEVFQQFSNLNFNI